MPCYRCGTRQVDPDRGESPWKRGVVAERQVLICPGCQSSFDWMGALDRCPVCESLHLVRRLGEIECRDCGYVRPGGQPGGVTLDPGAAAEPGHGVSHDLAGARQGAGEPGQAVISGPSPGGPPVGLAEEVERALEKVLGRTRRTAGIG